jgi:hypothetical protein
MTLSTASRTKLACVLALLGSDKPGERDAAGLAAHRMIQRAGVTWEQLLSPPPPRREPLHATWRSTCAELMRHPGDLRAWERKFVADLPAFPRISTKQRYLLNEIAARVLRRGDT